MPQKFTMEFEYEDGLWFAKSPQLNCFIAYRELKQICEDIPEIVDLVDARESAKPVTT